MNCSTPTFQRLCDDVFSNGVTIVPFVRVLGVTSSGKPEVIADIDMLTGQRYRVQGTVVECASNVGTVTFDSSDLYGTSQLLFGSWVGITSTARQFHDAQLIGDKVSRGDIFTFRAGDGATPSVGDKIAGQTSGTTGYIVEVTGLTGDWASGNAAGTIRVTSYKGVFAVGETIDIDGGSATAQVATNNGLVNPVVQSAVCEQNGTITLSGVRNFSNTQSVLITFSPLGSTRN